MEAGIAAAKLSSPAERISAALTRKGWCFRDEHHLPSSLQPAMVAAGGTGSGMIEAELLNMDLKEFGGRFLPDSASLKKLAYFNGPKVLQVVSVRDVSRSVIDGSMKSSSQHRRRFLRFCLTDGFSEVTAVEFVPMPAITEEIVPGTKVLLQNKIPIRSGILCLDPKSMSILGGRVETLYEEWEISQKYAGFSRSSLRPSQSSDSSGPPPFEKLQLGLRTDKQRFSDTTKLNLKPGNPLQDKVSGEKAQATQSATPTIGAKTEDKPTTSNSRPKEVSNAIPLQNQEAAQKLLQKMNQPNVDGRHTRGPKYRGKGNYNEPEVFTLDEWEKRKVGAKPTVTDPSHDVARDEELIWQLQHQSDLETVMLKLVPNQNPNK